MNTVTTVKNIQPTAPEQQDKTLKEIVFYSAKMILRDYREQVEGRVYDVLLDAMEKSLFLAVLDEYRGNQTKVSNVLSLSRGTLRKKFKSRAIDKHSRPEPYEATTELEQALVSMHMRVLHSVQRYLMNMRGQAITDMYTMVLGEVEEPLLAAVMEAVCDNQTRASKLTGLSRGTFRKKLKIYGIESH